MQKTEEKKKPWSCSVQTTARSSGFSEIHEKNYIWNLLRALLWRNIQWCVWNSPLALALGITGQDLSFRKKACV